MRSARFERGRPRRMPVNTPPPQPHEHLRLDARLDATTRAKVDDLAQHFHQSRAAVCDIMQWGLSRGAAEIVDGGASEGPVRHLYCFIDTELRDRVEKAAHAVGMPIARSQGAMVRQITTADFPASWQEASPEERSHDSRTYDTRFMLRLDEAAQAKLQHLMQQFGASKADIIRQLIAQATPEDFPKSWHMRAAERSVPSVRGPTTDHREMAR